MSSAETDGDDTVTTPSTEFREGSDRILAAVEQGLKIYDLGRPLTIGMPQSPNHPAYWHALPRRHGDTMRVDGGSAANDIISMGTHVGTHIDALAHVSQDGLLHGGLDASKASEGGRFAELGIHTVDPIVRRGVLLDIPAAIGAGVVCDPGYEITVEDLQIALDVQRSTISPGSVVLIRSGWGHLFDQKAVYIGAESGVPGIGEAAARWLAAQDVHAVGADTIAFERLQPGAGHGLLPAHRVLLVESGVYIIETLNLEELADAGVHEFVFVLSPLPLFGATGSPARPLAVVAHG